MWPLPLEDDYKDYLKSAFADLANVGGRWGGAVTAALFLKEFAEETPWVHLDIAGTAWLDDDEAVPGEGSDGPAGSHAGPPGDGLEGLTRMKAAALLALAVLAAPLARPADTDSMDSVVHAVYAVISGPAGTRDWARFRALFADGARLISMRVTADGPAAQVMSPDDYAKRAGANFEKNAFFESELARRVETFRLHRARLQHVRIAARSRRQAVCARDQQLPTGERGRGLEGDDHPVGRGTGSQSASRKVPEIAVQPAASGSCAARNQGLAPSAGSLYAHFENRCVLAPPAGRRFRSAPTG